MTQWNEILSNNAVFFFAEIPFNFISCYFERALVRNSLPQSVSYCTNCLYKWSKRSPILNCSLLPSRNAMNLWWKPCASWVQIPFQVICSYTAPYAVLKWQRNDFKQMAEELLINVFWCVRCSYWNRKACRSNTHHVPCVVELILKCAVIAAGGLSGPMCWPAANLAALCLHPLPMSSL